MALAVGLTTTTPVLTSGDCSSLSAQPMNIYSIRNNARFLTDRMAYTLGLSAAILEDLYYINYDYIYGVNNYPTT